LAKGHGSTAFIPTRQELCVSDLHGIHAHDDGLNSLRFSDASKAHDEQLECMVERMGHTLFTSTAIFSPAMHRAEGGIQLMTAPRVS